MGRMSRLRLKRGRHRRPARSEDMSCKIGLECPFRTFLFRRSSRKILANREYSP